MAQVNQTQQLRDSVSIPACAGIGLRSQHHQAALHCQTKIGWLEVHSENYFGKGGAALQYLEAIRAEYPLSLHGVGMSLGSVDVLDRRHMQRLKELIARIEPGLVSEHLSWSSFNGQFLNDLAPLPYTDETLDYLVSRISEAQDFLGRQLLIENPSSYLEYQYSSYSESRFLDELARRSGCGILLDINNVYVSCQNHGWNALDYLQDIAVERVGEIHLAGHTLNTLAERTILIDTHNRPVSEPVWQLYATALQRLGSVPTLIEWDADLPEWSVLLSEARQANTYLEKFYAAAA
jgi:uncharacterized protein